MQYRSNRNLKSESIYKTASGLSTRVGGGNYVKILVLEDELTIRSFIVLNLKRAGFYVIEATTGEEALQILSEQTVDIALLDVMLPGIDGLEVCKAIRKENEKIGIIMLTARVQDEDKVQGLGIGADDYIAKPFSPVVLTARIQSLLRRIEVHEEKRILLRQYHFR